MGEKAEASSDRRLVAWLIFSVPDEAGRDVEVEFGDVSASE
jgi:hypothetical protein